MAGIERFREIKRRRARSKKVKTLLARVQKGTIDRSEAVRKLRRMTTGADVIIKREGLA